MDVAQSDALECRGTEEFEASLSACPGCGRCDTTARIAAVGRDLANVVDPCSPESAKLGLEFVGSVVSFKLQNDQELEFP